MTMAPLKRKLLHRLDSIPFRYSRRIIFACLLSVPVLATSQPDLEGVWSPVFTTQDNEFWQVEDFACFTGCTAGMYKYLQSLLDDPANDETPFTALMGQAYGYSARQTTEKLTEAGLKLQAEVSQETDPNIRCQAYGLIREATNPLPMQITRNGDNLFVQYEEWNQTRTIFLDGREHPENPVPSLQGHSIGYYDGDVLVVETVGLQPTYFYTHLGGGGHTEQARVVERYTILEDPRRLTLELSMTDPVTLKEPYILTKIWLYTPEVELLVDSCEDTPAQP